MRLIATLLLCVGCATTRTDQTPTTPAVPAPTEPRGTPATEEARRLAAELETSLANPPPAAPEPTPPEPIWPEPFWTGYMVVRTDSVPPAVALIFAEGPNGDVITKQTFDDGVPLRAAIADSSGEYWLFPVTRGALLFKAVRVYNDGRVTVEAPIRTNRGDATIIAAALILDDPSGMASYRPCVHGVCGRLHKAVANRIVSCEGPGCADLMRPTP